MGSSVPGPYWRVRWAAVGALVALGLVGLGWLLTTIVKSPQEALATAEPPPPSRITVPVEERVLDLSLTTRARLTSPTQGRGNLAVEERDRAEGARRILVTGSGGEVTASLARIEANGDFWLDLDGELKPTAGERVQVVFEPRREPAPGLVVPISALFTSSSGGTALVVLEDGTERETPVDLHEEVGGFVRVTPVDGSGLESGDQVLVSEPTS